MADLVCAQHGIGSVVKANGQVVGYISAVNLHQDGVPGLESIKAYLKRKAIGANAGNKTLHKVLDNTEMPAGLILNYRLPNAPDQLATPLHASLFQELAEVSLEEPEFGFDNYILLTRSYRTRTAAATLDPDAPRAKRKKPSTTGDIQPFYVEEELYFKHATARYDFEVLDDSVEGKLTLDAVVDVVGHILIIPADAIGALVAEMDALVSEALEAQVEDF